MIAWLLSPMLFLTGARELFTFLVKELRAAYEHGTTPMPEQVVASLAQPKSVVKRRHQEMSRSEEKQVGVEEEGEEEEEDKSERRKRKRPRKRGPKTRPQKKTVQWAEDLVQVRVIPRRPRSRLPKGQ